MTGRTVGGVFLALLSAALLVVIWPTFGNLWWLAFVAFVPMYVAQYRLLPRRWSALAVAIAFGAYYFALFLNARSVLSIGPIIGIGVGAALVGGLIGMFLRPFAERSNYRWFVVTCWSRTTRSSAPTCGSATGWRRCPNWPSRSASPAHPR
jgi:apolipoprotein N-acyltransferase